MPLIDNQQRQRFEMEQEGGTVFAAYRRGPDILEITHVEAPPALRGTGAAGRFMEALMAQARAEKVRILPLCGYAHAWMRRHPEHQDLLA